MRLLGGRIRFEQRLEAPRWLRASVPAISLVLAAIITGLVLLATGHDPFATYGEIYQAAFVNRGALAGTFVYGTPLLFTGLAAAIAFRMKVWNIGGEGQLYMGAVAASGVGLVLGAWPTALLIPAMILAGMLGGLAWAVVPGVLKAYGRTNEILVSLMLNYVAGLFMYYLIYDSASYWRDLLSPAGKVFPLGKYLTPAATWQGLGVGDLTLPFGFVVGILAALLLWVVLRSTGFGFEMKVVGDSLTAADYAGIRTRRKVLTVMAISGAIAGIGGASQIGDFSHVLDPRGLQQAGYGYTGIVVAALALYDPLATVVVAFLMGALNNAGFALQGPSFPLGLVGVIEGIILFCVLAGELIVRYRVRLASPARAAGAAAPPAEEPPLAAGVGT